MKLMALEKCKKHGVIHKGLFHGRNPSTFCQVSQHDKCDGFAMGSDNKKCYCKVETCKCYQQRRGLGKEVLR